MSRDTCLWCRTDHVVGADCPRQQCGAVKPGPPGYAPITWTYCTRTADHEGNHDGPEFGSGAFVSWPERAA